MILFQPERKIETYEKNKKIRNTKKNRGWKGKQKSTKNYFFFIFFSLVLHVLHHILHFILFFFSIMDFTHSPIFLDKKQKTENDS